MYLSTVLSKYTSLLSTSECVWTLAQWKVLPKSLSDNRKIYEDISIALKHIWDLACLNTDDMKSIRKCSEEKGQGPVLP